MTKAWKRNKRFRFIQEIHDTFKRKADVKPTANTATKTIIKAFACTVKT